jgi:hypothetical protein
MMPGCGCDPPCPPRADARPSHRGGKSDAQERLLRLELLRAMEDLRAELDKLAQAVQRLGDEP